MCVGKLGKWKLSGCRLKVEVDYDAGYSVVLYVKRSSSKEVVGNEEEGKTCFERKEERREEGIM